MIRIVVVAGATGTGKTGLAVDLALAFGGEIVNADSQQVYRGLDIGTAKPTLAERRGVPHHLFDVAEPWDQFDAAQFLTHADRAIADVAARGLLPIVVGGTGLWLRALLKGLVDAPPRSDAIRARLEAEAKDRGLAALHARLREVDPEGAAKIQPGDPVRIVRALEVFEQGGVPLSELHRRHAQGEPRYDALQLALDLPLADLEPRLHQRLDAMYEAGLVEETNEAAKDPRAIDRLERVMGYREALAELRGELTRDAARVAVFRAQRQYAKRQKTWFKAEPAWTWLDARDARKPAHALLSRPGTR